MNRKANDPARARKAPPPCSDEERVNEFLAVVGDALEKMRQAVGKSGPPPNVVKMEFAAKHDAMLTSLIVALQPFVKPLVLDIPTLSYSRGNAVLECWWKERRV